jgi:hypothetical protein
MGGSFRLSKIVHWGGGRINFTLTIGESGNILSFSQNPVGFGKIA